MLTIFFLCVVVKLSDLESENVQIFFEVKMDGCVVYSRQNKNDIMFVQPVMFFVSWALE